MLHYDDTDRQATDKRQDRDNTTNSTLDVTRAGLCLGGLCIELFLDLLNENAHLSIGQHNVADALAIGSAHDPAELDTLGGGRGAVHGFQNDFNGQLEVVGDRGVFLEILLEDGLARLVVLSDHGGAPATEIATGV